MIRDLKPYPAYKNSGLEWLGQVPEHWDIRRTKTILKERCEKGFPNEPLLAATQTKGVIRKEQYENRTVLALKNLQLMKLVEKGDFVISLRSFQGGIEYAHERGIISPSYTILYPRDAQNSAYLAFLFKSRPYIDNLQLFVTGIREGQNIDYERLRRSSLPLPPHPDQLAIVRFLDYMERRIRRVIRARKKRIKLLEEYKQALIHEVVTGRIDVRTGNPYPAYKASGVEWLGEVPEHWDVVPIKRAFSSMDYGISESGSDSGTIRLLTMGHLKNGKVIIPDTGGVDTVDPNLLLSPGDLLFNRTNSAELVGKVALFTGHVSPVTFASYLVRMRPTMENEPEFLNLVLNDVSTLSRARREAIPSLHQSNLNPTRYGRLCIALPPKVEQQAISQILREQIENINVAIAAFHREIELLSEYRTRLIADVVTGKLDVREVAAQLPEEPAEEDEMNGDEIDEYEAEGGEADNETVETFFEEEVEP